MSEALEAGRGRGDAGFTLVETVVAFAILSLAMTTAVQIIGGGSMRMRLGQDRSTALAHAQSRLAALTVSESVPLGSSTGTFEDGFQWSLTVSSFPGTVPTDAAWSPFVAELTVHPPDVEAGVVLKTVLLGRAEAPAQ